MELSFETEMEKSKKFSFWFTFINGLMILPNTCFVLINIVNCKIGKRYISVRCKIPLLEDEWTDQQIKNFTQPSDMSNTCNFYDYDYGGLTSMNYTEALKYESEVRNSRIVKCTDFIISSTKYYTVFEEFSMVCDDAFLEHMLDIAPVYGLFLSCTIIPLADIVGRKRVINWGTKLFYLAGFLIPTAYGPYSLIIASFLTGFAYFIIQIPNQALVVELSNDINRAYRYLFLNMGTGLGIMFIVGITLIFTQWRYAQLLASISMLLLPLLAWYVPESPDWFHSKYGKEKTWPILKTIKNTGLQTDVLLYYRNEKAFYETAMKNWCDVKQLKKKEFWCLVSVFLVLGTICLRNYTRKFDFVCKNRRGCLLLLGVTEFLSCAIAFCLLFFCSRILAIILSFVFSGVSYFIIPNVGINSWYSVILFMKAEAFTSSAYIATSLYAAEFWPASNRCTMLSFVNGVAALATIVMYYVWCNVATYDAILYASGVLCYVAVILICYANYPKKIF